jgi:hypothetical protein
VRLIESELTYRFDLDLQDETFPVAHEGSVFTARHVRGTWFAGRGWVVAVRVTDPADPDQADLVYVDIDVLPNHVRDVIFQALDRLRR